MKSFCALIGNVVYLFGLRKFRGRRLTFNIKGIWNRGFGVADALFHAGSPRSHGANAQKHQKTLRGQARLLQLDAVATATFGFANALHWPAKMGLCRPGRRARGGRQHGQDPPGLSGLGHSGHQNHDHHGHPQFLPCPTLPAVRPYLTLRGATVAANIPLQRQYRPDRHAGSGLSTTTTTRQTATGMAPTRLQLTWTTWICSALSCPSIMTGFFHYPLADVRNAGQKHWALCRLRQQRSGGRRAAITLSPGSMPKAAGAG